MRRAKLKHLLKGSLVFFAATIASCLLAELVVVLVLGEQVKFPRHVVGADFGVRINQPGARYRHKSPDVSVEFRINSRGLRADREYPYEKPEGVKRIVSLGDSFTVGYEVEVEQCFSSVLERELVAAGYRVEVLNAGVSGYSTAEACLYLEREMLRYDPDLVLLNFYSNDLVDNIRTGLFRLKGAQLVQTKDEYVPLGKLADFLNRNAVFSFLSSHSNAFAVLKEQTTLRLKRRNEARNIEEEKRAVEREDLERERRTAEQVDPAPDVPTQEPPPAQSEERQRIDRARRNYDKRLTAGIIWRMYTTLHERGIPLVIQTIPGFEEDEDPAAPSDLIDVFPYRLLDFRQQGISCVRAAKHLAPYIGKEQLYWHRSHRHWTPFSHEVMGKAIAQHILENGLLDGP